MRRTPLLELVVDHGFLGGDEAWLVAVMRAAGAASSRPGVTLQLRLKEVPDRARRELLARGMAVIRASPEPVPALINGTIAEALELGADGAHWPEDAIPDARPPGRPPALIVGASVHSVEAARRAAAAGADFCVFGPVFAPGSKPGSGVGLQALEAFVEGSPLPVLAIGGIDAGRVPACLEAGCSGVAVVSAVFGQPDPAAAVAGLWEAVRAAAGGA